MRFNKSGNHEAASHHTYNIRGGNKGVSGFRFNFISLRKCKANMFFGKIDLPVDFPSFIFTN